MAGTAGIGNRVSGAKWRPKLGDVRRVSPVKSFEHIECGLKRTVVLDTGQIGPKVELLSHGHSLHLVSAKSEEVISGAGLVDLFGPTNKIHVELHLVTLA